MSSFKMFKHQGGGPWHINLSAGRLTIEKMEAMSFSKMRTMEAVDSVIKRAVHLSMERSMIKSAYLRLAAFAVILR